MDKELVFIWTSIGGMATAFHLRSGDPKGNLIDRIVTSITRGIFDEEQVMILAKEEAMRLGLKIWSWDAGFGYYEINESNSISITRTYVAIRRDNNAFFATQFVLPKSILNTGVSAEYYFRKTMTTGIIVLCISKEDYIDCFPPKDCDSLSYITLFNDIYQ